MDRRERILSLIQPRARPDSSGYVPAAFFLHFGPDYRVGSAAVARHLEFFRHTGMDFVKIQYERPFPPNPISSPADWASVPAQPESFFDEPLAVVRGIVEEAKHEAPVIVTLYSPFMCAGQVAAKSGGQATVAAHLEQDPEAVRKGLETIASSLRRFVGACIRIGVDGFYHSTQGGETGRFTNPTTFTEHVKPFDLALMNEINARCVFSILHICDYHRSEVGGYSDLSPFVDYPGHVINTALDNGVQRWTAAQITTQFKRPFLGGMDRLGTLATGTA